MSLIRAFLEAGAEGRPPVSWMSMWARSASLRTASGKERSSVFMTKANTSPPSLQPKQCHSCTDGSILNEGVFS